MFTETLPSNVQNFLSWQARRYTQLKPKEIPPTIGPFITVSREYGCDGIPLARGLADRLNLLAQNRPLGW